MPPPSIRKRSTIWHGRSARKPTPFALLDIATSLEFKGFEPGSGYNYRQSQLLDLVRLCGLRTIHAALTGNAAAAASSLTAETRLLLERPGPIQITLRPMITAYETALFSRLQLVLNRTAPSDAALTPLAAILTKADRDDAVTQYFLRDRADRLRRQR